MIRIVICLLLLLAIASGLLFLNVSKSASGSVASVLVDITDAKSVTQHKVDVPQLLHWTESSIWDERRVRIGVIQDSEDGQVKDYRISKKHVLFNNKFQRLDEHRKFEAQIAGVFDSISNLPQGKPQSVIYLRINKEMRQLVSFDAKHKRLIVFSDLQENSDILSLLGGKLTMKDFLKLSEPYGNSSISLEFVFTPESPKQTKSFLDQIEIYRELYEPIGVQVNFRIMEDW